jgi:hypothetical protein
MAENTAPPLTSLICPSCKEPVAVIENIVGGRVVMMHCPSCGNRWTADSSSK